jgi:hypothetical protein
MDIKIMFYFIGLWLSKYKVKRELFSDYLVYFDSAAAKIFNTITNDSTGESGWHPLVTGIVYVQNS